MSQPPASAEAAVRASGAVAKAASEASANGRQPQVQKGKTTVRKVGEIRKDVAAARSATAVVQVVRRSMDCWDRRWGAQGLFQIAKRSTARTRQEWAADKCVLKVAARLKAESAVGAIPSGRLDADDADVLLLSLEGLRRMAMQGLQEQRECLEILFARLAAAKWGYPVKTLSRLYWLAAPLKLAGIDALPPQLRPRAAELVGPDLVSLVEAMRQEGAKDLALLEKVVGRLKDKDVYAGLAATDLVELAEGLAELDQRDEAALRPLGQELQRRRGELTPDEAHRIQNAFQTLKLPLSQVWTPVGATKKRNGSAIVTTQAFAPQEGHEKKRRGSNDVERTSPPRVVRDYKMMSY